MPSLTSSAIALTMLPTPYQRVDTVAARHHERRHVLWDGSARGEGGGSGGSEQRRSVSAERPLAIFARRTSRADAQHHVLGDLFACGQTRLRAVSAHRKALAHLEKHAGDPGEPREHLASAVGEDALCACRAVFGGVDRKVRSRLFGQQNVAQPADRERDDVQQRIRIRLGQRADEEVGDHDGRKGEKAGQFAERACRDVHRDRGAADGEVECGDRTSRTHAERDQQPRRSGERAQRREHDPAEQREKGREAEHVEPIQPHAQRDEHDRSADDLVRAQAVFYAADDQRIADHRRAIAQQLIGGDRRDRESEREVARQKQEGRQLPYHRIEIGGEHPHRARGEEVDQLRDAEKEDWHRAADKSAQRGIGERAARKEHRRDQKVVAAAKDERDIDPERQPGHAVIDLCFGGEEKWDDGQQIERDLALARRGKFHDPIIIPYARRKRGDDGEKAQKSA